MLKNYYEPTPKLARKIGDSILYFSVAIQPLTLTLPVTSNQMLWINFGISFIGVLGKFITNLFKEDE